MNAFRQLTRVSLTSLAIGLSACGGGGGGGVETAGNLPAPTPTRPPAAPPPTNPLISPVMTESPATVLATGATPTLSGPGQTIVLPLAITAVTSNFSGDSLTTDQGATLTIAPNGAQSLTINNPAWNVSNTLVGTHPSGVTIVSGPLYSSVDLDYTSFGGWYGLTTSNMVSYYEGGGAWIGGLETPAGAMPVSGSASYAGAVNGQYSLYSRCRCDDFGLVGGNVAMTANFGNGSINGRMSNLIVVDSLGFNDPLNDILFSASIYGSSNGFQGTTSVDGPPRSPSGLGTPSGLVGLALNATGTISGRFFGPSAQEAGAVWTIDDGAARVIGSFGAKTGGH